MKPTESQSEEFASALEEHAPLFKLRLNAHEISRLRAYYELVMGWNARLHLVAPCPPVEFATRHVLESLLALEYLPHGARVVDVGSGAGLPIIPCLIVRNDLRATLIEASPKKAIFLREALRQLNAHDRAEILSERFEKTLTPEADVLTCRALERLTEMLPQLIRWSKPVVKTWLLFGGRELLAEIKRVAVDNPTDALTCHDIRIPESERRFLYIVERDQNPEARNRR